MTKLYTSLKQKVEDFIALMRKPEEYKSYRKLNQHLDQERDDLALELHQKDDIIDTLHQ